MGEHRLLGTWKVGAGETLEFKEHHNILGKTLNVLLLGFRLGPAGKKAPLVAWGHNQVFLGKSITGSRRYMWYASIEKQERKD